MPSHAGDIEPPAEDRDALPEPFGFWARGNRIKVVIAAEPLLHKPCDDTDP